MNGEIKYLKFKSHLGTYCPYCNNSFNKQNKEEEWLVFKANHKDEKFELKLSPYLDVFEREASIRLVDGMIMSDLICPSCNRSLISEELNCAECGSRVARVIISAFSKLIPFYLCMKYGCEWHGLSKADENRIKLKIPRQQMPEQDQILRVHNFNEVPYGLTTELALLEAGRCLQCKTPKCVDGCPVNVDIPQFVKLITEHKFAEAAQTIKRTNVLPAVCGRVCPQEDQCEKHCVLGIRDKPVAIGNLERFVADYERKMDLVKIPLIKDRKEKRIAIVGSGPGGLTCAADLLLLGYSVTVYEALHKLGGVLVYGIPEFRLPKSIVDFEIDYLRKLGCKFELNSLIGTIYTIDELLQEYNAVYVGVGAGLPKFMRIPGEDLGNVFSANEYLTRVNLMKAYLFPEYDTPIPKAKKVIVVGGGNVAMDCARNAIRMGAEEVTIIYRRSRKELPARIEEIHHAEQEGIQFKLLTNPLKYIGSDINQVKGAKCIRMELGEPDESGRRSPIPIKDSEFDIDCDMIIVAVGTGPNPIIFNTTPDLKANKYGYISVNPATMETSKEFVYAGGDIVTGSATVIQAMGAGRTAAESIHAKLSASGKRRRQ